MKRFHFLLATSLVVFFSLMFFTPYAFGFGCTVRNGACNSIETCLFSLYRPTNSHVGDCSAYNYKVCCDFVSSTIKASCDSNETGIFSMKQISNSHLELYGYFNYANVVCVNETLTCSMKTSCDTEEACVASFYRDLNSHAAICSFYPNKLCCKTSKPYSIMGVALYYDTGLPIESGVITGIIKETGEVGYATIADGLFLLKFNSTVNTTRNKFTVSLIINSSDNKMGYVQLVAGGGEFMSSVQTCSIKNWEFSGVAVDTSGASINSGNLTVSVEGELQTYTNSTTFSNGVLDISLSPCLISGNLYTFNFKISSGGKTSDLSINQIAK